MSFRTTIICLALFIAVACARSVAAQDGAPLTPKALETTLAARPSGADADRLAQQIRAWFGRDALARGPNPKVDELTVAWALETPGTTAAPQVVSSDGIVKIPLTRLDGTDIYAAAVTLPEGAAMAWSYVVDGRRVGNEKRLEVYTTHPDSREQAGVPRGKLTEQPRWKSRIFDGTERSWWVYVPAQYTPDKPACVMVFQDGGGYKNFVPTVFDNLIAKGDMPVTVGVFVDPGTFTADGKSNRSFEYDTLSDQYARFLLEEILPEVEKTTKLRRDAASRAIGGASSGGICAWTVAWEKPDQFGKVLSWIGSFTNIAGGRFKTAGGHNYPFLIRQTPPRPIRVFLQDGTNDLDNQFGNWWLSNQQMARALAFAKYDYKFVGGYGFHSYDHGRAILPDSLRWLWRDDTPGP